MPDFGSFRGFGEKLMQGQIPSQLGLLFSLDLNPLLLDVYTNAAVAYSLRKLKKAYNGSAIRVRRSSDNTEQDIGFTGSNVLDTSALTTFCGSGDGFVTTWYDQSGNGKNATQTTAANQPQIVSSGSVILQNSKPTLFTSVGSYRFVNCSFGVTLSNPQLFHVSLISDLVSIGYSGHWIDLGNDTAINHFISPSDNPGTYQDIFNSVRPKYGTFNATLNEQYLECYESVSGTTTRYLNGTNRGSNNYSLVTPTNLVIGGSASSFPAYGNIQEVVIYAIGNSSNRTAIETNINSYYGIY